MVAFGGATHESGTSRCVGFTDVDIGVADTVGTSSTLLRYCAVRRTAFRALALQVRIVSHDYHQQINALPTSTHLSVHLPPFFGTACRLRMAVTESGSDDAKLSSMPSSMMMGCFSLEHKEIENFWLTDTAT